jgi:hypothetical protein
MLKEFVRDKSRAQLVMIGAIVLNFITQFFLYFDDAGSGMLFNEMSFDWYTGIALWGQDIRSGWAVHWWAPALFIILAFVYLRDDIVDSKLFDKWGWWLTLVAMFSLSVGAWLRAPAAGVGGISFGIAIIAVWLHYRDKKAATNTAKS